MSGNRKIVHFLSASDRINYGDLLFPLIFKKFGEENSYDIDFYNYGIVKSDLSHFGALPTASYKTFQKNVKKLEGNVVIGGGEVFFSNWNTLYGFINPVFFIFKKYKVIKKLNIAKKVLANNKVHVPFCPARDELGGSQIKLYFSSVGGGSFWGYNQKEQLKIQKTLKYASVLSVRDQRSKQALKKYGINSKLVPDTAIIMSDYFNRVSLLKGIRIDPTNFVNNYIFLQVGKYKGPKHINLFVKDIKNIAARLGLDVILCPIGKAPGHEDEYLLQKIKSLEPNFIYVNPTNIDDIMFLIANAALYMGTSLHGMITAQSFDVPFVCFNKKIKKVSSYIKTWIDESMDCLNYNELEKTETIYKEWNTLLIKEKTNLQKQMVRANLKLILNDV